MSSPDIQPEFHQPDQPEPAGTEEFDSTLVLILKDIIEAELAKLNLDPDHQSAIKAQLASQLASPYDQAIAGLPLDGYQPQYVLLDQDSQAYAPIEDIANATKTNIGNTKNLIYRYNASTVKPIGKRFISLADALFYSREGRKPMGRPRKQQD